MDETKDIDPVMSAAARALAGQRQLVARTCAICGTPIRGIKRKLYCSPTCTTRAYRQRRQATPLTPQEAPTDDRA